MYGYTDEEPMRDDPNGEHMELSPGPEDDPNDLEDSTYQEDPSLALVAPAPMPQMPPTCQATPPPEAPQELPKKPKGKRKGKKIVVEEPEEIAIEEPEGP
jgi:hypothetical protein